MEMTNPSPCHQFPESSRSEEHTSELQSRQYLVCRLLLDTKMKNSAVVGAFGVAGDLWSTGATLTSARGFETLPFFISVAVGYLCITLPAAALLNAIARKV